MAARIIAGSLGGAISALAFVRSKTVQANQCDSKALEVPFYQGDNEVATQDVQLARAARSANSKTSGSFPTMEEPRTEPIATRHLILVRHGQDDGAENESAALSCKGREQASLAGKRLLEMHLPFTKIVHNGQRRAAETSNMIASYLTDTRREADSDLKDLKQESVEEAVKKYLSVAPVNQTGDSYVVVVCDEDTIKRFISRAMNLSTKDHSLKLQLHHASVSMLSIPPNGQVNVRSLGDTGYMTKEHFTLFRS